MGLNEGTVRRGRYLLFSSQNRSTDKHRDWKPLTLEIMKRFALGVHLRPSVSFAVEFEKATRGFMHDQLALTHD